MTIAAVARFTPRADADRDFFLLVLATIWAAVLAGFVPDALDHFTGKHVPYQWIVHVHAATYVGWLALLTTQMSLVRSGKLALHRRLGVVAALMIPWMLIVGPWAFLVMGRAEFGTPDGNTPFLILPMLTVLAFGIVSGAGLLLRRDPASHKRLMLIGTLAISDAGWGRWIGPKLGPFLVKTFGAGPLAFHIPNFIGSELVMAAMLIYDLTTRRRLNPAATGAVAFVLMVQAAVTYIYGLPGWTPLAAHLLGH